MGYIGTFWEKGVYVGPQNSGGMPCAILVILV